MAEPLEFRSGCPIATTLDLVGDRWSLVIVRDLLTGKKRYAEFLASPECIATNTLADGCGGWKRWVWWKSAAIGSVPSATSTR